MKQRDTTNQRFKHTNFSDNVLIYFERAQGKCRSQSVSLRITFWQNPAQIKPSVWVYGLHICAAETQRSVKQDSAVMSHIKWPVRTYYLFISLYRCLFLSPSLSLFSLRHVRFRRTPAPSPAQFKGKINMDKPPWEYWPLRTSTILFNVLDCTLMDTPSHTSSNHLALSHPHFFFPPFSAVSSSPGESTFHLYLAVSLPIVRRVDNPEIGREQRWRCDISVTVLSRLIEVSVKRKRIWGTPLDEWSGCQCYSCVKNEKNI